MSRPRDEASRTASAVLLGGVGCALALIVLGLAAAAWRGEPLPQRAPPAAELLASAAAGRPAGLLSLGLAVLLATPALRVAALTWFFARRREWPMLAASGAVLAVLAFSIAAGRAH